MRFVKVAQLIYQVMVSTNDVQLEKSNAGKPNLVTISRGLSGVQYAYSAVKEINECFGGLQYGDFWCVANNSYQCKVDELRVEARSCGNDGASC